MNFIFADFIDVKAPANHSHTLKARRALSLEAIRWHIDEVHRNEIHCLWFQFGRVYLENATYKTAYFIKLRKENSSKMLAQWNYRSFFFFFFFFFFGGGGGGEWGWGFGYFKNIHLYITHYTYIEPIVHQRWAKTGEPGEKPPDHPKQNLAFPHATWARLEPQRWET